MRRMIWNKRGLIGLLTCGTLTVVTLTVAGSAQARETSAEIARKPVVPPSPKRLADGHPNWTGFWTPVGGMLEVDIGLGGTPASAGGGSPLPQPPPFDNFAPLKSPYKEQYAALLAKMKGANAVPDQIALCFPPGMPRMMAMVYGMEVLQTPGQIAITSEWQDAGRRIWLDRKSHPPEDELTPSYAGDSVGHWEGDTLVVETIGIRDDVPLNRTGLPHSPLLRVIERFVQTSPGVLVDDVTIDDPGAFEKPWSSRLTYRYRPDLRIKEYVCLENNRNVGEHGEAVFAK